MINPDTIERIRRADPVPDADLLHSEPDEAAGLFSSIVRRRDTMLGTKLQRPTSPLPQRRPWYRRPALVFIAAAVTAMAMIVPVALLGGSGTDVADEPSAPAPTTAAPATTAEAPVSTTAGAQATTVAPVTVAPSTSLVEGPMPVDGYVWARAELDAGLFPEGAEIRGVTHNGSVFVAVGRSADDCARVWLSSDGQDWEPSLITGSVAAPCSAELTDVASKGSTAIAIDTGPWDNLGPSLWISENGGFDWSEVPSTEIPFDAGDWPAAIVASDRGFVIGVGAMDCSEPECFGTSAIWFSPDGRQWLQANAPSTEGINDVAAGPDGFIAVAGYPATVMHSADGETWSSFAALVGTRGDGAACFVDPNAVTYGTGGYVIAGDCVPDEAEFAYSSAWQSDDGVAWTQVPYDEAAFGDPAFITSIAADGHGYVAAGWTPSPTEFPATVWFSADGLSWTRTQLEDGDASISGVAVHGGTAVAVGGTESEPAVWVGSRP